MPSNNLYQNSKIKFRSNINKSFTCWDLEDHISGLRDSEYYIHVSILHQDMKWYEIKRHFEKKTFFWLSRPAFLWYQPSGTWNGFFRFFSALFKMIVEFTVEFTCVNKCHLNHIIWQQKLPSCQLWNETQKYFSLKLF